MDFEIPSRYRQDTFIIETLLGEIWRCFDIPTKTYVVVKISFRINFDIHPIYLFFFYSVFFYTCLKSVGLFGGGGGGGNNGLWVMDRNSLEQKEMHSNVPTTK